MARDLRINNAADGLRLPLNVMDGNYKRAQDVCPVVGCRRLGAQDGLNTTG